MSEPVEQVEEVEETVVEVPTTVIVETPQPDGVAAAVAVQADEKAEAAAALSVAAAEASVSAGETADASLDISERTYRELQTLRQESAEMRSLFGEWYREQKAAEEEARLKAESVEEVPVNAQAEREGSAANPDSGKPAAPKPQSTGGNSGGSNAGKAETTSTQNAPKREGGLRRRRNR